ncbi:MAG TPA: HlyD family efflux transporter periplasmic adaptor subunit [Gammaproteobacteria bacterium]|nr:HlyD family efflux transporter periplasmic adaptor subunit [Gammaproteobacteria bacterium]
MNVQIRKTWWTAALALAFAIALLAWRFYRPQGLPPGFAKSNGRIEAVEVDVATKSPGRIDSILANEGDFVQAGQVLARMDTSVLDAQKREAEAQLQRARVGIETAQSQVAQRQAEKTAAEALVTQRQVEREAARKSLARIRRLARSDAVSAQQLDDAQARFESARAAVAVAQAQVAAAAAALGNARSQVIGARADVAAAQATVQRIQADIGDSVLRAPRAARVQYRIAQPGEVLGAGAPVLSLVDLTDVYMTFFLPTNEAGRVALGSEVHLVLDAAPNFVIPARVSYVADVAQFTPKTVETAEERQKLMFRIKARIEPQLLQKHLHQVKTGLPGMAYVRLNASAEWPANLQVKLPQ